MCIVTCDYDVTILVNNGVATLALGSWPQQGFAKVRDNNEA
jgi:hypothetical protein